MAHPAPLLTDEVVRFFQKTLEPIRRYHDHSVEGLEHLPRTGGALLVVHHSLATYDGFLVGMAVWEATGRLPTALGDDMIFKTPGLKKLARDAGIRRASPGAGLELLNDGHLLFVAPGGMWESLRPSREARTVRWEGRRGFCRLVLRAQVPLILCACPAADDIYRVKASRLTDLIYKQFKAPLPLARGVGPTMFPRRVKLTHYIAEPIHPPPLEHERVDEQVDALHELASARMRELLER